MKSFFCFVLSVKNYNEYWFKILDLYKARTLYCIAFS